MAQVFNVSVNYLLTKDTERPPLNAPRSHAEARLADLDQLNNEERATSANVIDALSPKSKLRTITIRASCD